jgi:ketosteroid isomerase-like protein
MNHMFVQIRGEEKIQELLKEGQAGQALRRAGLAPGDRHHHARSLLVFLGILVAVGLLAVGLTGCASPASTPSPTATSAPVVVNPAENPNAKIVLQMVRDLLAGDIDGSLAYFAEDARSYFIGMPPTGMEFYQGREALRPMWEFCVSDNFDWEATITKVEGDLVYVNARTWLDFTRQLGVAPNEFVDVYEVKDGKIIIYGSIMTEEALEEFKPALEEVMPSEPPPAPASDIPLTEINVTIADGTCSADWPSYVQAGEVTVNMEVRDQDQEKYAVLFFTLEEGKGLVDLMASSLRPMPPSWSKNVFFEELLPGESQSKKFTAKVGNLYLMCWSKPPDLPIGNAGPFVVVP